MIGFVYFGLPMFWLVCGFVAFTWTWYNPYNGICIEVYCQAFWLSDKLINDTSEIKSCSICSNLSAKKNFHKKIWIFSKINHLQHKVKKGNVIRNYVIWYVIWYKVCGGPIKLQFSDLKLLYDKWRRQNDEITFFGSEG